MVAFNVSRLGGVVPLNFSRNLLFAAADCAARGDLIGAAIRIRECTRRQLYAVAIFHGVLPKPLTDKQIKQIKPRTLLRILCSKGLIHDDYFRELSDSILAGDYAIEMALRTSDAARIDYYIDSLHNFIDDNPCGETFERLHKPPVAGWKFDDDDENGDAWAKGGAV